MYDKLKPKTNEQLNDAPKAEWEYGLATQDSQHGPHQRIEQTIEPLKFKPDADPSHHGSYPDAPPKVIDAVHTRPTDQTNQPRSVRESSTVGS